MREREVKWTEAQTDGDKCNGKWSPSFPSSFVSISLNLEPVNSDWRWEGCDNKVQKPIQQNVAICFNSPIFNCYEIMQSLKQT